MKRIPVFLLLLCASTISGCASTRWSDATDCALIGAGVGTATGLIITIADDEDTGTVVAGGAVGAAVGALAGYGFCMITD
jgi:hypothetical protein